MALFHVQHAFGASVIEVGEDLDAASCPALDKAIVLADSGTNKVVVSLKHCNYCDSSGLGVLIRAKKRLGDRLVVYVPKDVVVRRIFEITALVKELNVHDSLPDSLLPPMAS